MGSNRILDTRGGRGVNTPPYKKPLNGRILILISLVQIERILLESTKEELAVYLIKGITMKRFFALFLIPALAPLAIIGCGAKTGHTFLEM